MLAPTRDIAPNGMFTLNVVSVATLNVPEAMIRPLKQVFSHVGQPKVLEYFSYFLLHLSEPLGHA